MRLIRWRWRWQRLRLLRLRNILLGALPCKGNTPYDLLKNQIVSLIIVILEKLPVLLQSEVAERRLAQDIASS